MEIKSYGLIEKKTTLSNGEVEFVVSTNALDAHGERIDVEGISLKDYKKNPVVLWGHDGFNLPIAKTLKIWKEGGKLMARALFDLSDEFSNKVYNKIVNGFLNAVSIGGMVDEWGSDGMTIKKMNMKEFSVVSIPANPEALATAKSLSDDDKAEIQELNTLAKAYAKRLLSDDDMLSKEVERLESLVATLKEVTSSETQKDSASDINAFRVKLKQAQVVDQQIESVIKVIKKGIK